MTKSLVARFQGLCRGPIASICTPRRIVSVLSSLALFVIALLVFFSLSEFPSHWPLRELQSYSFKSEGSNGGLSLSSFRDRTLNYHSSLDAFRFISNDAWRHPDTYNPVSSSMHRQQIPDLSSFKSKSEYMKQSLVADYAKHSDKMFLMIKTGATVLWDRLPVHLFTTLTRVPHFALYADSPSSIGGYEVIDILQNVTHETKNHDQFHLYRQLQNLRNSHGAISLSETSTSGGWDLDKFKNLPMLLHAYRTAPHLDWYVFMDADSYLMLDNLMDYLNTLDPNIPLYIGSLAMLGETIFNHGGSGVVLSRKALEISIGEHPEWVTESEPHAIDVCCGDYMVAYMLLKVGVTPGPSNGFPHAGSKFQGESYQKMAFNQDTWCQKVVSFHHLRPADIETLWEYERLIGPERRKNIRYSDIYRDFIAPYIQEVMFEWDNLASQTVFSEDTDVQPEDPNLELPEPRPWVSLEECKKACEESERCLAWQFLPHSKRCAIDENIRLGAPYLPWMESGDGLNRRDITSGFMVDRIRLMRNKHTKCDVLYKLNSKKLNNDTYSEGWYRRMQMEERLAMDSISESQSEERLASGSNSETQSEKEKANRL